MRKGVNSGWVCFSRTSSVGVDVKSRVTTSSETRAEGRKGPGGRRTGRFYHSARVGLAPASPASFSSLATRAGGRPASHLASKNACGRNNVAYEHSMQQCAVESL